MEQNFWISAKWLWKFRNDEILNVDNRNENDPYMAIHHGTYRGKSKKFGCGGVIRDNFGSWIAGFSKVLGKSNTLKAKISGLILVARLVWDLSFKKVWFEYGGRLVCWVVDF
ncbi:RnaseH [Senna tora]|uniref:RnaseH (Mitochondrion) n=1 Tax=Senna tora TaxID=362788 RepID=A0A834W2K8_9FABA|nr:RnaseH [Senna tora]